MMSAETQYGCGSDSPGSVGSLFVRREGMAVTAVIRDKSSQSRLVYLGMIE